MVQNNPPESLDWSSLGNIALGRPNLGEFTRLEVYRLMQYSLREEMERLLGREQTSRIFYQAGYKAGLAFHKEFLSQIDLLDNFIQRLQNALREMKIGVMHVEEADLKAGRIVLTISEDLDCSGLPESGEALCTFDEGFIAGVLESYAGRPFRVREVDCWCLGKRTCRFVAEVTA
ncbi:MAG: 4-vinyl reductase [Anaerolineae bacterium]|nr:4-vinyl reductase [Anaerolineae bacterium]